MYYYCHRYDTVSYDSYDTIYHDETLIGCIANLTRGRNLIFQSVVAQKLSMTMVISYELNTLFHSALLCSATGHFFLFFKSFPTLAITSNLISMASQKRSFQKLFLQFPFVIFAQELCLLQKTPLSPLAFCLSLYNLSFSKQVLETR